MKDWYRVFQTVKRALPFPFEKVLERGRETRASSRRENTRPTNLSLFSSLLLPVSSRQSHCTRTTTSPIHNRPGLQVYYGYFGFSSVTLVHKISSHTTISTDCLNVVRTEIEGLGTRLLPNVCLEIANRCSDCPLDVWLSAIQ